ncbi:glucose 1-dehydrogenase [Dawidia soli]|uniref:Glucose 1-dehydrogenase n=1 Tax=Dawidia soli TaxID=2782352 RepID=A0AAP2DDB3_9BACT|nr:glucose 1-dehydrogenase [Dawidia soli]MBT1688650.1 glucose 1-dehydrogenase [Dawidia soli]
MKLKDKVAVVTGGNSGIGFGIAEAFRTEGAKGAITGRNQTTLDRSVAALGKDFIGLKGDVTDLQDLERIFTETFSTFGKIDVLVVNAGGIVDNSPMGPVTDVGEEGYDKYMDLNLKSVYFTVQKALPYLNDGASIVLIGSSAGHRAAPGMSVYSAAKAAVISFAKGFSLDLLARKIRVNVVSPGPIDTPVFDKFVPEEQVDGVKQLWVNQVPAGRIGRPSDVGRAAVFLAADESSFILGSEILVDGGLTHINLMK